MFHFKVCHYDQPFIRLMSLLGTNGKLHFPRTKEEQKRKMSITFVKSTAIFLCLIISKLNRRRKIYKMLLLVFHGFQRPRHIAPAVQTRSPRKLIRHPCPSWVCLNLVTARARHVIVLGVRPALIPFCAKTRSCISASCDWHNRYKSLVHDYG